MANEPNIAELAVAAWRLERWLDNLQAERKMAAKSSLRSIKKFLDASGVEIVDPVGWKFDPGLPIEVVNNEAPDVDESDLIVIETNAPIIKKDDAPIQFGRVILGVNIKEQKTNNEIKTEPDISAQEQPVKTEAEDKQEGVLKQSKLFVSQDDTYWVKSFDCKAEMKGYHAIIVVDSDTDGEAMLLDEQVYNEYLKGIKPRNPFVYSVKAGSSYLKLPYRDIWYMMVFPPIDHFCREYKFDMNCEWKKDEEPKSAPKETVTASTESRTANDVEDKSEKIEKTSNETSEIQEVSENSSGEISTVSSGADAELSAEELEKLRSKNFASYNKVIAISKGLIPESQKKSQNKTKKKKKHRK